MVLLVITSHFLETELWLWPHAGLQAILSISLLQFTAPGRAAINISDPVIVRVSRTCHTPCVVSVAGN